MKQTRYTQSDLQSEAVSAARAHKRIHAIKGRIRSLNWNLRIGQIPSVTHVVLEVSFFVGADIVLNETSVII